jgi:hypothetical protein
MKTSQPTLFIIWIVVGILICIASAGLKLGSFRQPGSGMFPFIIGCGVILLSSLKLITLSRELKNSPLPPISWRFRRSVIAVLLLLIFYASTLSYLGFFLCTFVFLGALFKIMGRKTWIYAIFSSLTVSFISYMLFQNLLKINLPKGFLVYIG